MIHVEITWRSDNDTGGHKVATLTVDDRPEHFGRWRYTQQIEEAFGQVELVHKRDGLAPLLARVFADVELALDRGRRGVPDRRA